jgi:hypothetical protein
MTAEQNPPGTAATQEELWQRLASTGEIMNDAWLTTGLRFGNYEPADLFFIQPIPGQKSETVTRLDSMLCFLTVGKVSVDSPRSRPKDRVYQVRTHHPSHVAALRRLMEPSGWRIVKEERQ